MYRITGHYHGLASQSPRQPAGRAYRVQEAAMGPRSYPPVIFAASAMDPGEGP